MWKRRHAIDALLIGMVVVAGFNVLTWVPPLEPIRNVIPPGLEPSKKRWVPSAELDVQANADFAVEAARSGDLPAAGKGFGTDWPSFAGARRDNRSSETGLLPRWPSGGPALAWIIRGLGAGLSSVAVVDGIVYTMGNKGSTESVIALDVGTGKKIWATPTAWACSTSA
jgi:hypothetical protein